MRHSICFFFFIFCLTLRFQAAVGDIVYDTCKKISEGVPDVKLDFCVRSLGADPKSHTADFQGLAIISVNLIIDNANQIGVLIKKLLGNNTVLVVDPEVKKCLYLCQDVYSSAINNAQYAIIDFKSKDYSSANVHIGGAMTDSSTCEDGFSEGGKVLVNPLTKENNHFYNLATISLGFTVV